MATKRRKFISLLTVGAVFFSFHLCACQPFWAADQCVEHKTHAKGCENAGKDSDAASSCCSEVSTLTAGTPVLDAFRNFADPDGSSEFIHSATQSFKAGFTPLPPFEFPPGTLPKEVFLTSCFTHAP